jgi:signal transduction histidine kinase
MKSADVMTREDIVRLPGWAVGLATGSLLTAGTTMLLLLFAHHPGQLPAYTVVLIFYNVLLVLAFAVVSVALLRRLPRHPIGWLFGLVGLATAFAIFTGGYAAWDLPGTTWVLWLWTVIVTGPLLFGLGMALLLFPTGQPPSRRWRWPTRLLWAYLGAATLVNAVAPWPPDQELFEVPLHEHRGGWPTHNPIGWDGPGWLADANSLVPLAGVVLLMVSASSLVGRWRRSVGDERQQIKWMALAGLLFTFEITIGAIQALTVGFPEDDPVAALVGGAVFLLALASIPVAMGFGIVRYRLYDIDALISKTVVYGSLAVFIALAYVVAVVVVGELLGRWAGSSTLLALTATAVIAAAFQPLRTRLQAGADRWVYGRRAAPYELMTRFGHSLGQAVATPDVLARIAVTAGRAVRANAARVTVTLPNGRFLTAHWPLAASPGTFDPASFDMVVPVHHEGAVIAEISVEGAGARTADLALLQHTAAVSAGALRNLRLLADLESLHETIQRQNQEIAASRDRLVSAAQGERRRLEHLVTQRLGPDLDVLRDTLPRLEEEVSRQQDNEVADCERLAAHATHLVDEIRALSRGVLPPILADHGLVAALRALLRRADIPATLDAGPSVAVSRFPPHVETTVYLCCRAGLEAAARVGGATTAAVRLWRTNDDLAFSIAHDAPLGSQDHLTTARDRIITLDGRLVIAQEGEWSTVTGTVPVAPHPDQDGTLPEFSSSQ